MAPYTLQTIVELSVSHLHDDTSWISDERSVQSLYIYDHLYDDEDRVFADIH